MCSQVLGYVIESLIKDVIGSLEHEFSAKEGAYRSSRSCQSITLCDSDIRFVWQMLYSYGQSKWSANVVSKVSSVVGMVGLSS
ncbi:hypothetical protein ACOSP7_011380 [Xanthoceras sorbifolium]